MSPKHVPVCRNNGSEVSLQLRLTQLVDGTRADNTGILTSIVIVPSRWGIIGVYVRKRLD